MKKICFITTVHGTLESFILEFAKYMHNNSNYDVSFICNYDEEFAKSLPEYIHYIPVAMERGINISGIKAMLEMKKIFRKEKFDLIQYSTPNAAFYASIAGKLAKIKIRNYHLMGFKYLGSNGLNRVVLKTIEKITCKLSTSIECVSNSNLKLGTDEGIFKPNKATVIWNGSTGGIDLERFDYSNRSNYRNEIRKEYSVGKDEFVYGFVGRITRDKGINEIFESFNSIDDAKLLLVGEIEDINGLNKTLYENSLKNPNIIYVGRVSEVEKYFCAMDVLILPSYREGFGNVIIEAAAMGTPAIVSEIPGPVDAIERDKTALVVPAKDAFALLSAMKRIRELDYIEMGQNAAQFAKNTFDSRVLFAKILERKNELFKSIEQ